MAFSMFIAGMFATMRYWKSGEYGALGCMFIAPVSAVVAMFLLS